SIASAGPRLSEAQMVLRKDLTVQSFQLDYGQDARSQDIAFGADAASTAANIQQQLNAMLGAGAVEVTAGPFANSWSVRFTGTPGKDHAAMDAFVLNDFSQTANQGLFSKKTGFTGRVQNMGNITFGGGLNFMVGSGTLTGNFGLPLNKQELLNDFTSGRNSFKIDGNLAQQLLEDNETLGKIAKPVAWLTGVAAGSLARGGLSFKPTVFNPGIHLMAGGGGP